MKTQRQIRLPAVAQAREGERERQNHEGQGKNRKRGISHWLSFLSPIMETASADAQAWKTRLLLTLGIGKGRKQSRIRGREEVFGMDCHSNKETTQWQITTPDSSIGESDGKHFSKRPLRYRTTPVSLARFSLKLIASVCRQTLQEL